MQAKPRQLHPSGPFQDTRVATSPVGTTNHEIRHSSWFDSPDPAEIFEMTKAKAEWAEGHGFVESRELFASNIMRHFV